VTAGVEVAVRAQPYTFGEHVSLLNTDLEGSRSRSHGPVRLQWLRFPPPVGDRRLWQRHPILYRGDVDDYAGALFDHGRYERTDPNTLRAARQVLSRARVPFADRRSQNASRRARRRAHAVHAAEMLADGISDGAAVVSMAARCNGRRRCQHAVDARLDRRAMGGIGRRK